MARDDRDRGSGNQSGKDDDEGYSSWIETESVRKDDDRDGRETKDSR